MKSFTLRTHVGEDGILKIEIPTGLSDTDVEVVVIFHPVKTTTEKVHPSWPESFFEKTAGSIPDFPERAPQGEYEVRNELK